MHTIISTVRPYRSYPLLTKDYISRLSSGYSVVTKFQSRQQPFLNRSSPRPSPWLFVSSPYRSLVVSAQLSSSSSPSTPAKVPYGAPYTNSISLLSSSSTSSSSSSSSSVLATDSNTHKLYVLNIQIPDIPSSQHYIRESSNHSSPSLSSASPSINSSITTAAHGVITPPTSSSSSLVHEHVSTLLNSVATTYQTSSVALLINGYERYTLQDTRLSTMTMHDLYNRPLDIELNSIRWNINQGYKLSSNGTLIDSKKSAWKSKVFWLGVGSGSLVFSLVLWQIVIPKEHQRL